MERVIYIDEKEGDGYSLFFEEQDNKYKLTIKRLRSHKVISGAIYYETVPKHESFAEYYRFAIRTIEDNIPTIRNLHFWNFGRHAFKHILQHRN